jgi:hypothetical protein
MCDGDGDTISLERLVNVLRMMGYAAGVNDRFDSDEDNVILTTDTKQVWAYAQPTLPPSAWVLRCGRKCIYDPNKDKKVESAGIWTAVFEIISPVGYWNEYGKYEFMVMTLNNCSY